MKRPSVRLVFFLAIILLSVNACGPTKVTPTPSIKSPSGSTTAVATQTVNPKLTAILPTLTRTPIPAVPSATVNPGSGGTVTAPTSQGTTASGASGDAASFVSDVTVPDGTTFKPGEPITKTWRLSNTGSTTWTTGYSVVYISGTPKGNALSIPLTAEVLPGKNIDITAGFTAPTETGQYTSFWMLKNTSGDLFGVGSQANEPIYMMIFVSTLTGTGTVNAPTSTPAGNLNVTAATLTVDKTTYSGACPVTLNLTGTISAQGSGSLTYQLETGATTPGFTFTLPSAQTQKFTSSGNHSLPISYYLDIASSVTGWVRLYVSAPNTLRSTQINFTITCK